MSLLRATIPRQVGTPEAVIAAQIRQGITPFAYVPLPVGTKEEEIVGGEGGSTVQLLHASVNTTNAGAATTEGEGGGKIGGGIHTTSGYGEDGLRRQRR